MRKECLQNFTLTRCIEYKTWKQGKTGLMSLIEENVLQKQRGNIREANIAKSSRRQKAVENKENMAYFYITNTSSPRKNHCVV